MWVTTSGGLRAKASFWVGDSGLQMKSLFLRNILDYITPKRFRMNSNPRNLVICDVSLVLTNRQIVHKRTFIFWTSTLVIKYIRFELQGLAFEYSLRTNIFCGNFTKKNIVSWQFVFITVKMLLICDKTNNEN